MSVAISDCPATARVQLLADALAAQEHRMTRHDPNWTWPSNLDYEQGPNFVQTLTDPNGVTHALYGQDCTETWQRVPQIHHKTGRAIGTELRYGFRQCGQPGRLEALVLGASDDDYTPIYMCAEHSSPTA